MESLKCKRSSLSQFIEEMEEVFPSHTWGMDFAWHSTAALLQTVPKPATLFQIPLQVSVNI